MDATTAKQLRRLRTLGRGASGAVVWLASDDASGQLLAVKSAGAGAAETLRREGRVMAGLCSPHIVPCLGSRVAAGGEYQLFLEFAPRGSLADEAARSGGNLAERAIQGYAADVARGLAYLHGNSLVHGDVKARNVMVGADGRAKLADFGCARAADSDRTIGGTPAFMAPEVARGEEQGLPAEVARGEEQGLAADVWALGCTVIEMATGRAPWSDMDDVFAAVHRIGYTDAVPELPESLSPQAKDFLIKCLERNPRHRSIHCRAAPRAPVSGVRLPRRRRGAGEAGLDVPQEHTQRGILGVGRGKRNRGHANERGREDRLAGEPLQGFARLGLRRWLDRRARRTLRSFRNNDGHGDRRHRFRSLE